VPGVVEQVMVAEGQPVTPGTTLVRLRNLQLESDAAMATARFRESSARSLSAELRYADFSRAERERDEAAEKSRVLADQLKGLQLTSPIAGVVVTPHTQDLLGDYVGEGTEVIEIADLKTMTARIYIPEFEMRDVRVGTEVRMQMPSQITPLTGVLNSVDPLSSQIDPALAEKSQLSGIVKAPSYVGFVSLRNDGSLREGMTGTAKLFVRRQSLATMATRFARDLAESRFW
jgi:putative peptide zinc metalloprotease protein